VIALTLMGAVGTALSARAASAPAGLVFGVRCQLTGKTTLDKNHFSYAVPAGSEISDAVIVSNFTDAPLSFHVHGADLENVSGGGIAPIPDGTPSKLVGAWISTSQAEIMVPAHREVTDPFAVAVPSALGPGSYFGAVVVSKNPAPGSLLVLARAALIVQVTIPGVAHVRGALGPLTGQRQGDDERFSITVHNTGNELITVNGEVTVRDGSTEVASLPLDQPGIYIIPGGSATLHTIWRKLPSFGTFKAVATVRVRVNVEPHGTLTSNTLVLSFFAWPVVGEAVLLSLLTILALALLAFLLWRRSREACTHCGSVHPRRRLTEVTEMADVPVCRRCLRNVHNVGRVRLCTGCLKQHLPRAGWETQTAGAQPT
jgi:hypothetical protein